MTEFDPDKVEWPQKGFAHPAYEHKMPPGSDHPANVAMYYDDPPLVVPAEALRQAAERIKELEASWESLRIEAQRREAELTAPLPLEVTDEMVEAVARAFWNGIGRGSWSSQNITVKDRYRELTRACLSAALTQKGEA